MKFLLFILMINIAAGFCTSYTVTAVTSGEKPAFDSLDRIMRYEVNIEFDTCPPSFWMYVNKYTHALTFELFDAHLRGTPARRLENDGNFIGFSIHNDTVAHTQTRLHALITFRM